MDKDFEAEVKVMPGEGDAGLSLLWFYTVRQGLSVLGEAGRGTVRRGEAWV
jgi:hypothetical protein